MSRSEAPRPTTSSRARRILRTGVLALASLGLGAGGADAQSSTMRERIYDKLSRAEVAAEAGDFEKAHKALRQVERVRDLSPYERAQLYAALGFTFYRQGRYAESIVSYEAVLDQADLPPALESGTLYTLAQLQFQNGDLAGSVASLDRWLGLATDPGPEPYLLRGQALYQLERHEDAIPSVEAAIEVAERKGRPIPENWYLLLRVLHFESENWPEVLETLEVLVTRYPKREYWGQLASMYGQTGADRRQLAAYEVAYLQGYLERSQDLEVFAQLLLQEEVPYRAATVLEKGIADGIVDDTVRNQRLLSQAWTLARENGKAVAALTEAAARTEDGALDARLARALLDASEWEKAAAAAREAISKGVEAEEEVQVVLGMALFELGRFDQAKSAFERAQGGPSGNAAAAQWVGYIEAEQRRLADLERSLR